MSRQGTHAPDHLSHLKARSLSPTVGAQHYEPGLSMLWSTVAAYLVLMPLAFPWHCRSQWEQPGGKQNDLDVPSLRPCSLSPARGLLVG